MADQAAGRSGGTTVVFDTNNDALYFSKRVIPHCPESDALAHERVYLHLGVYAYRTDALRTYSNLAPTILEEIEGLEQLRFLESGGAVRVVPTDTPAWDCIELNNPTDTPGIEAVLSQRGIN
jgi:3-deoxy-manno-octulosonate cytidylyltransferase (CMP-KDO synthetase)